MRRLIRIFACALPILLCAPHLSFATDNASTASSMTRYVWANSLFLREQADGKSAQLAKIPYGAALTLSDAADASIPHSEVFAKVTTDGKTTTAPLDGAWRKVHWQDKDGWVFDGYLSRYPAPIDTALEAERKADQDYPSIDLLYARHTFGAGSGAKMAWHNGDNRKTANFQAMCKYLKSMNVDCKPPTTEGTWNWEKEELAQGASYFEYNSGDGPGENSVSFRNMPLTFNEAILWASHFNDIAKSDKNPNGGTVLDSIDFKPGKALLLGETRPSGDTQSDTVTCTEKACDIDHFGTAD